MSESVVTPHTGIFRVIIPRRVTFAFYQDWNGYLTLHLISLKVIFYLTFQEIINNRSLLIFLLVWHSWHVHGSFPIYYQQYRNIGDTVCVTLIAVYIISLSVWRSL